MQRWAEQLQLLVASAVAEADEGQHMRFLTLGPLSEMHCWAARHDTSETSPKMSQSHGVASESQGAPIERSRQ